MLARPRPITARDSVVRMILCAPFLRRDAVDIVRARPRASMSRTRSSPVPSASCVFSWSLPSHRNRDASGVAVWFSSRNSRAGSNCGLAAPFC